MKAFNQIVNELYTTLAILPDKRTGANVQFPMQDIGLTAFSVFFMHYVARTVMLRGATLPPVFGGNSLMYAT